MVYKRLEFLLGNSYTRFNKQQTSRKRGRADGDADIGGRAEQDTLLKNTFEKSMLRRGFLRSQITCGICKEKVWYRKDKKTGFRSLWCPGHLMFVESANSKILSPKKLI